jgi:hypothetical protein
MACVLTGLKGPGRVAFGIPIVSHLSGTEASQTALLMRPDSMAVGMCLLGRQHGQADLLHMQDEAKRLDIISLASRLSFSLASTSRAANQYYFARIKT